MEENKIRNISGGLIALGVLSIVMGMIDLLYIPFGLFLDLLGSIFKLNIGIPGMGIIISTWGIILIPSGIGTFLAKNWARILAFIYAWGTIILIGMNCIIAIPQLPKIVPTFPPELQGSIIGGFIGGVIGALAYPIILLVFYRRPKVIDQFKLVKSR